MADLTQRQRILLEFVQAYIEERGYPPSYREIAAATGLRSTNGVAHQLNALVEKGYLERDGGGASRSLRLTGPRARAVAGAGRVVPLLGRVVAGLPANAEALDEGSLVVDPALAPPDAALFGLRVRGESMVDDGILDGDIVIVRSQEHARENDVVVAVIDGETTVKRFRRRGGRIWLDPANRQMSPIAVPEDRPASIAGVVVGVYRKLV